MLIFYKYSTIVLEKMTNDILLHDVLSAVLNELLTQPRLFCLFVTKRKTTVKINWRQSQAISAFFDSPSKYVFRDTIGACKAPSKHLLHL